MGSIPEVGYSQFNHGRLKAIRGVRRPFVEIFHDDFSTSQDDRGSSQHAEVKNITCHIVGMSARYITMNAVLAVVMNNRTDHISQRGL